MIGPRLTQRLPSWFSAQGPEGDVVVSTRVRLARSLVGLPFPGRASLAQRKRAYAQASDAVSILPGKIHGSILNFSDLENLDQQFLLEKRVASPALLEREGDRGVAFDADFRVSIMMNEEDHLRLQCIDAGMVTGKCWESISAIDTLIGSHVTYAFDTNRGFLTSCPTNAGTGLRISYLLHLPGLVLTKTIDQVLVAISQMGISTRGFYGEQSVIAGNLFQLSNQAAMGMTEEDCLATTEKAVRYVLDCERTAREKICKEAWSPLEDKVYRSWGILLHARTLSMIEYLNLTSAVRTGLDCGVITGPAREELNRLTMLSQTAHLKRLAKDTDDGHVDAIRAELVRKTLGTMSLNTSRNKKTA